MPSSTIVTDSEVLSVRYRVKDANSPYKLPDEVYCIAFEFALQKLSFDFKATPVYLTTDDVPYSRKFLAVKLATIEMCYIRASDSADTSESATDVANDGGDITMVTVPGLQIQEGAQRTGSHHWLEMADRLQAEYDGELGTANLPPEHDALPLVSVSTMTTTARRTGGERPYAVTTPIDAPGNFTAVLEGSEVVVRWDPVRDIHFDRYEIFRSTDANLSSDNVAQSNRVTIITNVEGYPQIFLKPKWSDKDLSAGTYYYMMSTVSDNDKRNYTDVVTVVVP